MKNILAKSFEQTVIEKLDQTKEVPALSPAALSLELGALSMRFARVERVPRYEDGRRESDAEHSYMLSLIATELAYALYPEVDIQLIGEYSRVHDLIEVAVGDVATFDLTPDELAAKEAAEHAALDELLESLPPYTARLLRNYERQADIESRIVKLVDKLLPVVVDILGQGRRVMEEDYGVKDVGELHDCHTRLHDRIAEKFSGFDELIRAHGQLCDLFEAEFTSQASPSQSLS